MKVLLIGCTGFIGTEIIQSLQNIDCTNLFIVTRNKSNKYKPQYIYLDNILVEIGPLIEKLNPTHVVNALDDYSGIESRALIMSIHDQILFSLSKIDEVRLVYLSSAAVYGLGNTKVVFNESSVLEPINQYGIDKIKLENLYMRQCERCPNLSVAVLRIFNVLGKNQRPQMMPAAFINDLDMMNYHEILSIWGNRSDYRDYIDVRDVALAVTNILFSAKKDYEIYNVSSNSSISVSEICNYVLESLSVGFRLPLEKSIKTMSQGDNTKLLNDYNWRPEHKLQSSIDYQIYG